MARKITIALLIIISYMLQTTYNNQIAIGNITPNLLIIIVCVFALLRGRKEGLIIGFFAGILPDLFYGYADITGFYSLVYMYLGYMIGFIHEIIYTDDIIIPVAFTAICDFFSNFLLIPCELTNFNKTVDNFSAVRYHGPVKTSDLSGKEVPL